MLWRQIKNPQQHTVLTSNNVVGATETKHLRKNKLNNSVRSINATDHSLHSGNKWNPRRQNLHGMRQRIPRPAAQYNKGLTHRKRAMSRV
jgi:hypothetical protein